MIANLRTHVIYVSVILILIASAGIYSKFFAKPKIEIKTVTQVVTKTVDKVVYVDRVVTKNTVTQVRTIKKKNGDTVTVTTTTDKDKIDTQTHKDIVKNESDKTVTTDKKISQSSYKVSILYPFQLNNLTSGLDYSNTQVIVGARLGELPVFLDVGTNFKCNQFSLGLTVEF